MKNILTILTISCFVMTLSCKKDKSDPIDTSGLNVSFRAVYDGEPLVMNQDYDYFGNKIRFSRINFYVSNLVVVNDGGETDLSEIQFINLTDTHNSTTDAIEGTVMNFSKVPIGTYNQIKFGIGVPSDLNRTSPSDYSTSHPLGTDNLGEYWEAWDSYIFAKFEGQYDQNGDGDYADEDDIAFAYHVGTDKFYIEDNLAFTRITTLRADEVTNLNFELDLKRIFTEPNGDKWTFKPHDPNNQVIEMALIQFAFEKLNALQLK